MRYCLADFFLLQKKEGDYSRFNHGEQDCRNCLPRSGFVQQTVEEGLANPLLSFANLLTVGSQRKNLILPYMKGYIIRHEYKTDITNGRNRYT
jgi:hypothetical protein